MLEARLKPAFFNLNALFSLRLKAGANRSLLKQAKICKTLGCTL